MTVYAVGCDIINGKESAYINQAIDRIQKAGHSAINVGVNPNAVQGYGGSNESNGKIGVYIAGGRGLGTPLDLHTGIQNGYYHYSHVYLLGSSEFTGNDLISSKSMDMTVDVCEPGMSSIQCNQYLGLTPRQFNEKFKNCTVIYADKFDDCLNTMLGGGDTSNTEENNYTSFKDMVKDLLSVWDGRVEAWLDGRVMNIRHIPAPEDVEPLSKTSVTVNSEGKTVAVMQNELEHNIRREPVVWASESVNIVHDTLSMSDYNSDGVNKLIVTYTNKEDEEKSIIFSDEILISRFGEKPLTKPAVGYLYTSKSMIDKNENNNNDNSENNTDSNISSNPSENSIVEYPLRFYGDALKFGYTEWFKIQRANGHTVECKVLGSNLWRVGRWAKVYLPVFSEYCDMYVNRVNHTLDGGEWLTNVEFLPAPACLSEDTSADDLIEQEKKEQDEDSNDEEIDNV